MARTGLASGLKQNEQRKVEATVDPFAAEPAASEQAASVVVPPGYKLAKARAVLPHVSVYLHPKAIREMKRLAEAKGQRPHALYLEALDRYLRAETGQSLADLSKD